ncbi:MAG: cell division protein FtsK [Frankiales bacterium]|nr:cell division protein FtsK [Frankiales bacterium]
MGVGAGPVNRLGATRHDDGPVRVQLAKVHVPLSAVVGAWLARKLAAGIVGIVKHPARIGLVIVLGVLWDLDLRYGPWPILLTVLCTVQLLAVWRFRWPDSFRRHVTWRARGVWRARRMYRFVWQPAMVTTGLAVTLDGKEFLPSIRSIRSSESVDQVSVRMLPGQCLADWAAAAPRLAQTFGVLDARVRSVPRDPRRVVLWLLTHDPLTSTVPPFQPSQPVDLAALPVAKREDGLTYRLRLLGTHVLIVGATGSGKGSVLWSVLAALGPAIRDRLVEVWAIDPKGGMELAPGAGLFTRFSYGDGDAFEHDYAAILEDAVAVMRRRQTALRGVTRRHEPTTDEPLTLLVVDELASLTAYVTDRDAKRRIAAALSLLLSQGRAVGVSVIGALQDPRKEVLPFRDLFPTRIALRLSEAEQVTLVLGHGARDRGARCDLIAESTPGVGYVTLDGVAEPVRVRFAHHTDPDITELARTYSPHAADPDRVQVAPSMLTATGATEHQTGQQPQLKNRPEFRWPWEKNA